MKKVVAILSGAALTIVATAGKLSHSIARPENPHIRVELNLGSPHATVNSFGASGGVVFPLSVPVADQMPEMQDAVQILLS